LALSIPKFDYPTPPLLKDYWKDWKIIVGCEWGRRGCSERA